MGGIIGREEEAEEEEEGPVSSSKLKRRGEPRQLIRETEAILDVNYG